MSKCEHEEWKQIDYEFLKFNSCSNRLGTSNCMVHTAYVECIGCGMLGEREIISCGCKITWGEEE